ncbi:hypothetical protein BDDG_12074 [Blastomyces dermatitidis ATCC 18188]|uniref:Uncharacterized protein n=1 Tax=Ajellomyces dermatitidis (strain ATCC 18188 / CBS 674.68) TaxID=653446 RepID=A0A0J9HE60_AJEDA|nr:hypothetical protein BDDG_12074 [Blastomyces dermatitidis ATCC 18188]
MRTDAKSPLCSMRTSFKAITAPLICRMSQEPGKKLKCFDHIERGYLNSWGEFPTCLYDQESTIISNFPQKNQLRLNGLKSRQRSDFTYLKAITLK